MHPSCVINARRFINNYLDPRKPLTIVDVGSFNVNGTLRPLFTANGYLCTKCGTCIVGGGICCGQDMVHEQAIDGINVVPIQTNPGQTWKYYGLELQEGCRPYGPTDDTFPKKYNVDIFVDNPYNYSQNYLNFADVVVSTSCLEHDPMFWMSFNEMVRITKPNGLIYINVPSAGPYHGFPQDCYRFMDDAYRGLAQWNHGVDLLESYVDQDTSKNGGWKDNVGIFRKKNI